MRSLIAWFILVSGFAYIGWAYTLMADEGLLLQGVVSALLSMVGVASIINAGQRRFDDWIASREGLDA